MAKRKHKAKRSLASLPKGLPQRKRGASAIENPFETSSRQKRPKQEVHNRHVGPKSNNNKQSALARSLQRRQTQLKASLDRSKKSNAFVDYRIGEYTMTTEEQALARIVRERSRRSKKISKYSLEDSDNDAAMLTHRGKAIDDLEARDHVLLSSDDEADGGDLEAIDTELHFGGGSFRSSQNNPYGSANQSDDMAQVYQHKKTELDDLIARRKILKAERVKSKETQVEAFETMDESFKELASLLNFRDKEKERKERLEAKMAGTQSKDDLEMAEWDKEMKEYLFERKVRATDRTKTPDEIAAEEAERLQELETRRLARMNGDFENDDLTDISDEEEESGDKKRKRKKVTKKVKKRSGARNPDELDDSDEEDNDDEQEARFTADGLVYLDKDGNIVKKAGDDGDHSKDEKDDEVSDVASGDSSEASDSSDSSDEEAEDGESHHGTSEVLSVGTRVKGNYRAAEQYEGKENWYDGAISKVNKNKDGTVTYNIDYDDGDFEEDMDPVNVRPVEKSKEEKDKEKKEKTKDIETKVKRQKAKKKARQEIPFVFEVPTTLEALHDIIGTYASTGADASLIIQRIHKANSVRLDKRNVEKMQNFYDVLLRRFIAVGDAIYTSGDGGEELGRYGQLDALTHTLYAMSQDSPGCAGAVWGRRLGIFQNALAKRLRDSEFIKDEEEDESAWPFTGTFLLLRALGHVFPVTDLRHHVVTPAILLIGQMIAQTPVRSIHDLVMGVLCCGLMIEYTKDAKRIAPEALAFMAGVLRLFAVDSKTEVGCFPIPSLEAACRLPAFQSLRSAVSDHAMADENSDFSKVSLEEDSMDGSSMPTAILCSALELVRITASQLGGCLNNADAEVFAEITQSLLCLKPKSKRNPLPDSVASLVIAAATAVSDACKLEEPRLPLMRRTGPSVSERAIKSLAPRMEDPSKYSLSKDKGKSAMQAAIDRTRREYKREHKAVSRELRLDAAFIEHERRKDKERKDNLEREKRHKNFAWLEGEQAAMNQQVRQGGGLLSGGGTGAARAKVKNAQMGIKKGGKFR